MNPVNFGRGKVAKMAQPRFCGRFLLNLVLSRALISARADVIVDVMDGAFPIQFGSAVMKSLNGCICTTMFIWPQTVIRSVLGICDR